MILYIIENKMQEIFISLSIARWEGRKSEEKTTKKSDIFSAVQMKKNARF